MYFEKPFETVEQFTEFTTRIRAQDGYVDPQAFAIGFARVTGESESERILDVWYPHVNFNSNHGSAAVFAAATGTYLAGNKTYDFRSTSMQNLVSFAFRPFLNDGKKHENIDAFLMVKRHSVHQNASVDFKGPRPYARSRPVVTFIGDLSLRPESVCDLYLRLHALSLGVLPRQEVNLDGMKELLPLVAWTSEGPILQADLAEQRIAALACGRNLVVHSVGLLPGLANYIIPKGCFGNLAELPLGTCFDAHGTPTPPL